MRNLSQRNKIKPSDKPKTKKVRKPRRKRPKYSTMVAFTNRRKVDKRLQDGDIVYITRDMAKMPPNRYIFKNSVTKIIKVVTGVKGIVKVDFYGLIPYDNLQRVNKYAIKPFDYVYRKSDDTTILIKKILPRYMEDIHRNRVEYNTVIPRENRMKPILD